MTWSLTIVRIVKPGFKRRSKRIKMENRNLKRILMERRLMKQKRRSRELMTHQSNSISNKKTMTMKLTMVAFARS
jgi:hypothetical protein